MLMPQISFSSLRSVLWIKIFACGAFYNNWLLFVVFCHLNRIIGLYFSVFHLNRIIGLYFSVLWSLFGTYFWKNGSLFGSLLGTFFCRDLSCQHWSCIINRMLYNQSWNHASSLPTLGTRFFCWRLLPTLWARSLCWRLASYAWAHFLRWVTPPIMG